MIQVHGIKDVSFFLKDGEKEILSLRIGPVPGKRYYLFLIIRKNEDVLLRILSSSTYDFLSFAREYIKENNLGEIGLNEFCSNKAIIQKYIECFGQERIVSDEQLICLLRNTEVLKIDEDVSISGGLDGYSLEYHSAIQKGTLRLWCHTDEKSEYYRPIIDLANYLMDMADIDKDYRFLIYKRRYINE